MMAQEEKARVDAGMSTENDISASAFLLLGTEIQTQQ